MSKFEAIPSQAEEDASLSIAGLQTKYGPNGHPTHRLLDWVRTQDIKMLDNPGLTYWLWVRSKLVAKSA